MVLATASEQHQLQHLLGMSIPGSADVTNESFLNQEVESASVHAVMQSYEFSTLYDAAALDTIISGLLPSGYGTDQDASVSVVVFEREGELEHFQTHPVQFSKPSYAAPAADAITRPWGLMQAGRGGFGFMVVPFTIDADGSAVQLLAANSDRSDIQAEQLWLLTTDVTTGATDYHVDDGTGSHALEETEGLQGPFELASADQVLTVDCQTQDITGIALIGRLEPVANG